MTNSPEYSSTSAASGSVEAVAAQLHAATEQIHLDSTEAAGRHLGEATEILTGVADSTENPHLTEAQQSTEAAAHAAGSALTRLTAGATDIVRYSNEITGGSATEVSTSTGIAHSATASVGSAAGNQARPADSEAKKYAKKNVVVERRRLGNAHFVVALCEHTPENAQEIADAMGACDIYAFESVGAKDHKDRVDTQVLLSMLVSDNIADETAQQVFNTYGKAGKGAYIYSMAEKLRGTNAVMIPIDMDKTHPQYSTVVDFEAAAKEVQLHALVPYAVDEVRTQVRDMIAKGVVMNSARDQVMRDQLAWIAQQAQNADTEVTIGVSLGATHYNAIEGFPYDGEPDSTTPQDKVYDDAADSIGRAHMQHERHGAPLATDIDRIVLATYSGVHTGDWDKAKLTPDKMTDDEVTSSLRAIDEIAMRMDIPFEEKRDQLKMHLDELAAAYSNKPLLPAGHLADASIDVW